MTEFGDKNIRRVLEAYNSYTNRTGRDFTREGLEHIGFSDDFIRRIEGKTKEVDGKKTGLAWLVVDKLVKRAGRNHAMRDRRHDALISGADINDPSVKVKFE